MEIKNVVCGLVVAGLGLVVGAETHAAFGISTPTTKITNLLQQDGSYGGCMARINPGPATIASDAGGNLDCPGDVFVSFDCEGVQGSKSGGSQRFSTAMAAMITDRNVQLVISDAPKLNGFCRVVRIDLF